MINKIKGEKINIVANNLYKPVYLIANSAYNKTKKEYPKILILLLKIDFLFTTINREEIKAITGINKGNIIRLFNVGMISFLKFPLHFLSL